MLIYVGPPPSPVQPGDLVIREKKSGLGLHYGTGVSGGLVKDNTPELGKHITTFDGFRAGKQGLIVRPKRSDYAKALVEQRTLSNVGDPYRYEDDNCEHDASFSQTGVALSPTVSGLKLIAGLGFLAYVAHQFSDRR